MLLHGTGGETVMGSRIHLHRILFIVLSTAFVALVIEFTGEFSALWPLYGIPIIVAALTFHSAGAVLMTAITAALVTLHSLDANVLASSDRVMEAIIGIGAFLLCGLIVGVLTRRQQMHALELERTSVYDPLTGLYSGNYFVTRLEEETRRRTRYNGEMALLIIELDDYKEFRETFGTHRGDLLIEHLAEVTKIAIRNTDILARHGDNAFALICPHCTHAQATEIAGRLTELIEATEFEGDELEPVTMHTVSIGVGTCPEPAHDAEELLALAESRLRTAKEDVGLGREASVPPVDAAQVGEA